MSSDRPMNRRRFFREGLRELLRPLGGAVDKFADAAQQIGALESMVPTSPSPRPAPAPVTWLRPPGAVSEAMFTSMCTRCGDCVRACPVQCIQIDPAGIQASGGPYIDPDHSPCVVCDGLLCMNRCPTGALVPLFKEAISMGTALWHEETCLRHDGGSCTLCIDKCPMGSVAIQLREGRVEVLSEGCIGCGVCQNACPLSPKSITVVP
ncbi:MAG TPA: 4Fe-4S dicluster domain-containing protein, partial [Tepidisphaeraceae bacterium]|nr:4Fe-4S dicluster domain-containing protein [Tepidisphaeraceae bacterium]